MPLGHPAGFGISDTYAYIYPAHQQVTELAVTSNLETATNSILWILTKWQD